MALTAGLLSTDLRKINGNRNVTVGLTGQRATFTPGTVSVGSALNFGDSLVVNGTGFGSKSNTSSGQQVWDYGQAGAGVLDSQWSGSNPSTVPGGTGNYKNYAPGTNSVAAPHIHCQNIGGGLHGHFNDFSIVGPWLDFNVGGSLTYPFYVFIDHYFAVDPNFVFNLSNTDWNWKHNVYGTSGGGIDGNSWYEEYVSGSGTDNPPLDTDGSFFDNHTPPQAHCNDDNGSFDQPTGTWYGTNCLNPLAAGWQNRKHLYKISNASNGGFLRTWENNNQVLNVSNRTDGIAGTDRSIQVGAYARQYSDPVGTSVHQWRYYAALLVFADKNPGRFFLGNNNVLASCTILEPQSWTSWTSTSVSLKCNQGKLGAGTWPLHYMDEVNGNQQNIMQVTVNA